MNNKLITALSALCGGLCLLIAGEWWYNAQAQSELLSTAVAKPTPYQADELPSLALDEQTEDSYADLANRPLFIKGRRPVDEPKGEEVKAAPTAVGNFDWQLRGFYTKDNKLVALFTRVRLGAPSKDNRKAISIGEGDLDGWKLTEIRQSNHGKADTEKMGVTLSQDCGGTKVMVLREAKPTPPMGMAHRGGQPPPDGSQPPPAPDANGQPPPAPPDAIPEPESEWQPDPNEPNAEDFENDNAHF